MNWFYVRCYSVCIYLLLGIIFLHLAMSAYISMMLILKKEPPIYYISTYHEIIQIKAKT